MLTACGHNYDNVLVSTHVVYSVSGMESYVNASDVADKKPEEVAAILGEPLFSEAFDFAMSPDKTELPVTNNYYSMILDEEEGTEVGRSRTVSRNGQRGFGFHYVEVHNEKPPTKIYRRSRKYMSDSYRL